MNFFRKLRWLPQRSDKEAELREECHARHIRVPMTGYTS
jgi:hypothetical protein